MILVARTALARETRLHWPRSVPTLAAPRAKARFAGIVTAADRTF
jgi:hypothetical protein